MTLLTLSKGVRNLAKLTKKHITNKLGHQTTVWVRMFEDDELPSKAPVGHTLMELGGMIFTKYSDKAFSISGNTKENLDLIREIRETLGVGSWGGKTKAWYFPLASTPHVFGMMQAKLDADAQKLEDAGEEVKADEAQAAADKAQAIKLGIPLGDVVLVRGKPCTIVSSDYDSSVGHMVYAVKFGDGRTLTGLNGSMITRRPMTDDKKIADKIAKATPETRVAIENALFGAGDLEEPAVKSPPKQLTEAELPTFDTAEELNKFMEERAQLLGMALNEYRYSDEHKAMQSKMSKLTIERRRVDNALTSKLEAIYNAARSGERKAEDAALWQMPTADIDTMEKWEAWRDAKAKALGYHIVSMYRGTQFHYRDYNNALIHIEAKRNADKKEKLAGLQGGIEEQLGAHTYVSIDAFTPIARTVTVGERVFELSDYSHCAPTDVKTLSPKAPQLLTDEYPKWMPPIHNELFKKWNNRVEAVKVGADRYALVTNGMLRDMHGAFKQAEGGEQAAAPRYAIVNTTQLAAMQDYMRKRLKAAERSKSMDGSKVRIRKTLASNRATYSHWYLIQSFYGNLTKDETWAKIHELTNIVTKRTNDLEIDREYDEHTYTKGEETSYGDGGTKDDLLASHGVKVKRQNGDEISQPYIDEIRKHLDDVYSTFGKSPELARSFGLKISHSGEVLMHARKALGIYFASKRAIGVSNSGGALGFTLAHEWAHFLDNQLGKHSSHRYASDNPASSAHAVADRFRDIMAKEAKSDTISKGAYWTRTCECFARAMEQYYARKTGGAEAEKKLLDSYSKGGLVSSDVFTKDIEPLCEQFLKDHAPLIKSLTKSARFIINRG